MITMKDLGVEKDQVWRIDPHRPNPADVEIMGSGTQGGQEVILVRSVLPGGFTGKALRPVSFVDFVHHAVLLCDVNERLRYDTGDWREPFVR